VPRLSGSGFGGEGRGACAVKEEVVLMRKLTLLVAAILGLAAVAALGATAAPAKEPPPVDEPTVGGANSPPPSPPQKLILETAELAAGAFSVKVPVGTYEAPPGGAANYSVPGPIVAFKGPDGVWRGHGYLETYPRLLKFEGKAEGKAADLLYGFEGGKSYRVRLAAADGAVLLDEAADLGPRNLYVFDCYYGPWLPKAGFALDLPAQDHAFLYLPCYYDKPEVTVNPAARLAAGGKPGDTPGAVAVLSADPATRDVAGFWCRQPAAWKGGDTMGFQLWQHRQLPGDPSSRHFLGPETKSDSTPNPRTAPLLGPSLYEGHVTIEFNLGTGTRRLGFAVTAKGPSRESIPEGFKKAARANP
jgi:hypothetical protein